LSEINRMLCDFIESQSCNSFEIWIWLLESQYNSLDASRVSYASGKSFVMSKLSRKNLAIYARAHAADSLTPGSNYSTQTAKDYKAPLLIIDFERVLECLANDRRTKHAAFL
jgi:hypothetical protein